MERHHITTSFDSPLQFFPTSQKQIISNPTKIKNASNSTHRRANNASQKIMQRVKKLSQTYKNSSAMRKNKSKCETETHQSTKKRNTENQSLSKKTLRKRKQNSKAENDTEGRLKLSSSKNQEQSLTLKSSGKRNWPKKQLFHSTCFSRHLDQDLQMLQSIFQVSSDVIAHSSTHSNSQIQRLSFKKILDRTKDVLNSYQSQCQELRRSCNFYKNELSAANKKLDELGRKSSTKRMSKHCIARNKDCKESIRSTLTGKNDRR